jgi:hypothetical protein
MLVGRPLTRAFEAPSGSVGHPGRRAAYALDPHDGCRYLDTAEKRARFALKRRNRCVG